MIDREKVLKALECLANNPFLDCDKCPYNAPTLIPLKQRCDYTRICANALDLLKEQEAVKPIGGYGCYICGVCKNPLTSVSQKFCSVCGKAVKWDD